MKYILSIASILFCALLVRFSNFAIEAARNGVDIWWDTLLPTLFPFFASATLIERSGTLYHAARLFYPISKRLKISHYAIPVLFLGGMSGYPSGARLCGALHKEGALKDDECERLAAICNLCSPMFLIGALASGIFFDARLFIPLAAGHYGGALISALFLRIFFPVGRSELKKANAPPHTPLYRLLPKTLFDGMSDMSKVGGSVIFFLVLAEMLVQIGLMDFIGAPINYLFRNISKAPPAQGILLGLFEMTGGCLLVAQAGMPKLIAVPICAFLTAFGGFSVMVQAMAFVPFKRPARYALTKLFHGAVAAAISYFILSRQTDALEVFFAFEPAYAANALSSLAVLFACSLGLISAYLIAAILGRRRQK